MQHLLLHWRYLPINCSYIFDRPCLTLRADDNSHLPGSCGTERTCPSSLRPSDTIAIYLPRLSGKPPFLLFTLSIPFLPSSFISNCLFAVPFPSSVYPFSQVAHDIPGISTGYLVDCCPSWVKPSFNLSLA